MTDRADLDIELIDRYLRGDIEAFNELMEAHEDRVFAVSLRMLRDREAALDATQDTFLTVFRKVDRYKATAAFSTWLYRVAVNTCYDHLRRQKRNEQTVSPKLTISLTRPLRMRSTPSTCGPRSKKHSTP